MKIITAFVIVAFATIGIHSPSKADNIDTTEATTNAHNTINEIKAIDTEIKRLAIENLNLITKWDIRADLANEKRSKLNQVLADKGETFDVIRAQKELIAALYKLVSVIIDADKNKAKTIELMRTINEELAGI